jgi:PAS domain S-box-containing protein
MLNPGGNSPTLMSPAELQEGIASLSRGLYFKEASLDVTLSVLTEAAAQMSGVERVGIWALTDDQQELRCLERFELSSGRHLSGGALSSCRFPVYFGGLRSESCIAADDASSHPLTSELTVEYLQVNRISAKLDTPIHIRGVLQGVLTLEQVGGRQPWTPAHRMFAQAVANLVTLALVEYEAGEARRQADLAQERMQAVFDASRDALLLADGDSGVILDANRQAERLFGCARSDLVGKHQRQLHPSAQQVQNAGEFTRRINGKAVQAVTTEIQRRDGRVVAVRIETEVADISDGRRLALGIFREI